MRHHPYKLYGAILLAVVVGLIALSVLFFNQAFTSFDHVTVHVQRAGLQLLPGSDVKVRGLIVGDVESITSDGDGADIVLRLDPDQAKRLPRNVTVRMLPKTVFGEKYVDLVLPSRPQGRLADGTTIDVDRTRPTLEIDQALNDLLPVLRTVSPVELNHTLTALGSALNGRGEQLGQTIEQFDRYLRGFNPQLPQLHHDFATLGDVTRNYATAADPLIRTLGNVTVTSDTIVAEHQQLLRFLVDVAGAADATRDLLATNAHNLIAANRYARPVVNLLARYSPEYPCFFRGYAGLVPRIHDAVSKKPGINHSAHVIVELVPSFPTYSNPIDLPEFKDKRGPHCYGLPHPPMSLPVIHYKDGTEDDPRFDAQGGSPGHGGASGAGTTRSSGPLSGLFSPSMGIAGTGEERTVFDRLLGPMLGVNAAAVPDIADLLWGPMARGQAVNLR